MPQLLPETIQSKIEEIRDYRARCYTDNEIMTALKISKPTLYKYKKLLLEQNREVIAQRSQEQIQEEITLTKSRLEKQYRELQAIIDSEDTSARSKIEAHKALTDITMRLLTLEHETPDIRRDNDNKSNRPIQNNSATVKQ